MTAPKISLVEAMSWQARVAHVASEMAADMANAVCEQTALQQAPSIRQAMRRLHHLKRQLANLPPEETC